MLAYHRAGALPPGVMVKLYFGSGEFSFGLPPTVPSLEAYLAMLEGTDLPWLVSAHGGGDVVGCGLARAAFERGGHVQVGLEPFGGPRTPTKRRADRGGRDGRLRGRTPDRQRRRDRRDPRAAELPRRPDAAVRRGVGNGRARPAGRRR